MLKNKKKMAYTKKELQVVLLGFEFVEQYEHDGFVTNRFKKGFLEIEFTYKEKKLVTFDLTMEEINCLPVNTQELVVLDTILNK